MARKYLLTGALVSAAMITAAPAAQAGVDEYVGEIMTVGFNFCPRGTLEADGRLLAINENQALFSLFGTMYGGDGRTTFGLPDLRGRTIIGAGHGPGLTPRQMGDRGGIEADKAGPALARDGATNTLGDASVGDNMQPYLTLKHCVVTQGLYPSRN